MRRRRRRIRQRQLRTRHRRSRARQRNLRGKSRRKGRSRGSRCRNRRIDTDVIPAHNSPQYSPWRQRQVAELERYERLRRNEPAQASYRSRESSWSSYPNQQVGCYSTITPPDSGYGTPDYINSATSVNSVYNDWFAQQAHQRAVGNGYTAQPHYSSNGRQSNYHSRGASAYPGYSFQGHNIWDHNIVECNCASCRGYMNKMPYFNMSHNAYGQPCMG